jgi:hypothetical protein
MSAGNPRWVGCARDRTNDGNALASKVPNHARGHGAHHRNQGGAGTFGQNGEAQRLWLQRRKEAVRMLLHTSKNLGYLIYGPARMKFHTDHLGSTAIP